MDAKEFEEKIDRYLETFEAVKKKTGDERIAMALIQEVNKDLRTAQIRAERGNDRVDRSNSDGGENNNRPASEKQKNYLKKLGVKIPAGLTKNEASILIDEELGKESEQDSSSLKDVNVPLTWHATSW